MTTAALVAFFVGLLGATLRVATPLIFATIGELYTERAGILNLGIEGIMFLGPLSALPWPLKPSKPDWPAICGWGCWVPLSPGG